MTRLIHKAGTDRVPAPEAAIIDPTAVSRGVVTYHDLGKGYGKIHSAGVEYFFHVTACLGRFRTLVKGTPVIFVQSETDKGPRALVVQRDLQARSEDLDAIDQRGNR